MGILALAADERVSDVQVTDDLLTVYLMDGRIISVPIAWYPRLSNATTAQRNKWNIGGGGYGIHWDEIDEDLSTEGLLRGAPAPNPSKILYSRPPNRANEQTSLDDSFHEGDDPGIIDHLLEGEEAAIELNDILFKLKMDIETLGKKVAGHSARLDRLNKHPSGKARDFGKLLLLAASDMNTFAKNVEEKLSPFQQSIDVLTISYSGYLDLINAESEEEIQGVRRLDVSIAQLLDQVTPVKQSVETFKASTVALGTLNLSRELRKAASRQSKAIQGIVSNLSEVESFALTIKFRIDEKLRRTPRGE